MIFGVWTYSFLNMLAAASEDALDAGEMCCAAEEAA